MAWPASWPRRCSRESEGRLRFIGIDFGWQGKPSGLAVLDWRGDRLECTRIGRGGPHEVLEFVDQYATPNTLVAVDGPLIIPNRSGSREVEKQCHRVFGKYHAGPYPMNRSRPAAKRLLDLERELRNRGFTHADTMQPRSEGRFLIEVFPHPAIVRLFGLDRIIRYKKGPIAGRRRELQRYRRLILSELSRLTPPFRTALAPVPKGGSAMKDLEDQLDALLCAYIGASWWYWGAQKNDVLGDAARGYMIVPKP